MKKFLLCLILVASLMPISASAISVAQENAIVGRCDTIKEKLKAVQYSDSRARVYLGRYYETILSKFITPLNVRLVENNLSDSKMISNQDNFAKTRTAFIVDFVEYQKVLEELVAMDCKTEPEEFYGKLETVREKRKVVANNVARLKKLAVEQVNLTNSLKERL